MEEDFDFNADNFEELIDTLRAEVFNGGFDQYFFNTSGDYTSETITLLQMIGAYQTARILEKAASKFPEGMPPKNRSRRQEELEQVSPEGDAFDDQDDAFYGCREDLATLLKKYKSENH